MQGVEGLITVVIIVIMLSIVIGLILSSYIDKKVDKVYGKLVREVYLRNNYQEDGTGIVGTCTDVEVKWFGRIYGEKIYIELTDDQGYAKWIKVDQAKLIAKVIQNKEQ